MTTPYLNPDRLVLEVAREYGVSQEALKGPRRTERLANARRMLMWMMVHKSGMSYGEVGEYLNRDRTTVSKADRDYPARLTMATQAKAIRVLANCQPTLTPTEDYAI